MSLRIHFVVRRIGCKRLSTRLLHASGKHVRPLLVLLTAKACGKVTDHTINSAVFLELLHTAHPDTR